MNKNGVSKVMLQGMSDLFYNMSNEKWFKLTTLWLVTFNARPFTPNMGPFFAQDMHVSYGLTFLELLQGVLSALYVCTVLRNLYVRPVVMVVVGIFKSGLTSPTASCIQYRMQVSAGAGVEIWNRNAQARECLSLHQIYHAG